MGSWRLLMGLFGCFIVAVASGGAAGAERRVWKAHASISEDGAIVTRTRTELFPRDLAQARNLSRAVFTLNAPEQFELLEAYTRKADGSIIQAAPIGPPDDTGVRIVEFRNLQENDSRILEWRITGTQAPLPGVLSKVIIFNDPGVEYEIEYSLDTSESFPLHHSHRRLDYREIRAQGRLTRVWSGRAMLPNTDEGAIVDQLDHIPYVALSNIPSYERLGELYFDHVLRPSAISPQLGNLAAQLTREGEGTFGKTGLINEWLVRNVHVKPSALTATWYRRPDPAAALERGSGDAKEHVAITAAMLKAVGIETEFVLINTQRNVRLPEAPVLQVFNHLILYIPALDYYMDPTERLATFGTLPAHLMDSPIIRISERGVVVARTPVGAPDQDAVDLETRLNISVGGHWSSETTISAKGRFAYQMRQFVAAVSGRGLDVILRPMAQRLGYRGDFQIDAPLSGDRVEPYVVKLFSKAENVPPLLRTGWRIPHALGPIGADLSSFFGPARFSPRHYPAACNPGVIRQMVRVQFPSDVTVDEVPEPLMFTHGDFNGRREWTFQNAELAVLTTMNFAPASRICSPKFLHEFHVALDEADESINPLLVIRGSVVANPRKAPVHEK